MNQNLSNSFLFEKNLLNGKVLNKLKGVLKPVSMNFIPNENLNENSQKDLISKKMLGRHMTGLHQQLVRPLKSFLNSL
jgi:hypothetical protein